MKFANFIFCFFAFIFFSGCNDGVKNFNDEVLNNLSSSTGLWKFTFSLIADNNNFGNDDISKMAILQKHLQENIEKIQRLETVGHGQKYKQAVVDLYNYAIGTCKAYSTIFEKKPSKYTLQERNKWLTNANYRYEYYFNLIINEQIDFANNNNYKLKKSSL